MQTLSRIPASAAQRIAKTDPNVNKHLVRDIGRMVQDCSYEAERVAV